MRGPSFAWVPVVASFLIALMQDVPMTGLHKGLPVVSFSGRTAFERWLEAQVLPCDGAWLRLFRKGSDQACIGKAEAIDCALCHGWIDGQLDKYDAQSWLIRFTPRRRQSKWSQINCRRAEELVALGRMRAAGQAEIDRAKVDGRWEAAYAPASRAEVPADLQAALDANPAAAAFFAGLTGANRYAVLYRIGAVKREKTRMRKIAEYVAMLEQGETIHGQAGR